MEIVLSKLVKKDGKEITQDKTYLVDHVKARMIVKAFEITEKINFSALKSNDLNEMANYVVEVYKNQFTIDDLYDGLDSDKFYSTIIGCITEIAGITLKKMSNTSDTKNKGAEE